MILYGCQHGFIIKSGFSIGHIQPPLCDHNVLGILAVYGVLPLMLNLHSTDKAGGLSRFLLKIMSFPFVYVPRV